MISVINDNDNVLSYNDSEKWHLECCKRDLLRPLYLTNRHLVDPSKGIWEDLYMIQRDGFISTDSKCVVRKFHRSILDWSKLLGNGTLILMWWSKSLISSKRWMIHLWVQEVSGSFIIFLVIYMDILVIINLWYD